MSLSQKLDCWGGSIALGSFMIYVVLVRDGFFDSVVALPLFCFFGLAYLMLAIINWTDGVWRYAGTSAFSFVLATVVYISGTTASKAMNVKINQQVDAIVQYGCSAETGDRRSTASWDTVYLDEGIFRVRLNWTARDRTLQIKSLRSPFFEKVDTVLPCVESS